MEKGGSPRFEGGTAMPRLSAHSMSFVRELSSHSRQGAITLMSGFRP